MKSAIVVAAIDRIIGLFKKKDENKGLKVTTFAKTISIMTILVLVVCILSSLFPNHFKVDSWIYDLLETLTRYITI